jgi:hypothetical protein
MYRYAREYDKNNGITPSNRVALDATNFPNIDGLKFVDANHAWVYGDDDGGNYAIARLSYDANNNHLNLDAISDAVQDGNGNNIEINNVYLLPGRSNYFVVSGGEAKQTVVAYYDEDEGEIKLYPVGEAGKTFNAGAYVQEPTVVLVHDSINKGIFKVLAFNFDKNEWEEKASVKFDRTTPTSITKVNDSTYVASDGTDNYLIKYSNDKLEVAEGRVPDPTTVEYPNSSFDPRFTLYVDTDSKYADIYYLTYNDLTQCGNLKVRVHLPNAKDSTNSGIAAATLYKG